MAKAHIVPAIWILVAALAAGPSAAAGARSEIRADMPLTCAAEILRFDVLSKAPLVVDASVRQACNGDHELSVTYDPQSVADTGDLTFDYDGRTPVRASLGSVGFGAEHHTDAVRALHITYNGGSDAERAQFAHTIAIAVTPR